MGGTTSSSDGVSRFHPSSASRQKWLAELLVEQTFPAVRTPDFEIDLLDLCVRFPDGEEVRFTPRQWRLLELLVRSAGRRVSTASIAGELFGDDAADEAHQIPILMLQLRRKIEADRRTPRYVRSLDANTYLFDPGGGRRPLPRGSHLEG